jgi:glucose-6-phosphate 1-dehydrogenase
LNKKPVLKRGEMNSLQKCLIVIFGASGDLAKRKLLPALFEIFRLKQYPQGFAVLGVGRSSFTDEKFREMMATSISQFSEHQPVDVNLLKEFIQTLFYQALETGNPSEYPVLNERLRHLDESEQTGGNYLFYLSTPPSLYLTAAEGLGAAHLNQEEGNWKRLIVEKPFGYDLASSRMLNLKLRQYFKEEQIYRIDHYLGKETVQNLLVFRFSNGIFEPLWNRNYIHHVEITSAEQLGVEGRGQYYDGAGALRDMIQNHLLQVLAMVAMEPPASFDSTSVRNETLKVFQAIRPIPSGEVGKYSVRGQYTASRLKGEMVPGYREEKGVPGDSRTETYTMVKLMVDNWRWGGIPFYVRAGKRLPTRVTEVVIHFKCTPHSLFGGNDTTPVESNQLILRIQPDEGILLKFGMKLPGAGFQVKTVGMDFHYSDLTEAHLPTAYERLLLDCMNGDSTLYTRGDAVEACWKIVTPLLEGWKDNPQSKLYGYPAGTWGPQESDDFMGREGIVWRQPCRNLTNDGLYCEL